MEDGGAGGVPEGFFGETVRELPWALPCLSGNSALSSFNVESSYGIKILTFLWGGAFN